jgi:hypothetical protein
MEITLTVGQALWAFILALGIPSALTGFLVWNFERKIAKREAKREKEQEERSIMRFRVRYNIVLHLLLR